MSRNALFFNVIFNVPALRMPTDSHRTGIYACTVLNFLQHIKHRGLFGLCATKAGVACCSLWCDGTHLSLLFGAVAHV